MQKMNIIMQHAKYICCMMIFVFCIRIHLFSFVSFRYIFLKRYWMVRIKKKIIIAFAYKAKSFATTFLIFFSFSFSLSFLNELAKVFQINFRQLFL